MGKTQAPLTFLLRGCLFGRGSREPLGMAWGVPGCSCFTSGTARLSSFWWESLPQPGRTPGPPGPLANCSRGLGRGGIFPGYECGGGRVGQTYGQQHHRWLEHCHRARRTLCPESHWGVVRALVGACSLLGRHLPAPPEHGILYLHEVWLLIVGGATLAGMSRRRWGRRRLEGATSATSASPGGVAATTTAQFSEALCSLAQWPDTPATVRPPHLCVQGGKELDSCLLRAALSTTRAGPMHVAALLGQTETLCMLLDLGVSANLRDGTNKHCNPLLHAAYLGHADAVTALLDRGANPHKLCGYGDDGDNHALLVAAGAWHHATGGPAYAALDCLLDPALARAGFDAEENDEPCFRGGSLAVLCALLEGGADCNLQLEDGVAALHIAAYEGDADVARLLFDAGTDCMLRTTADGDGFFYDRNANPLEVVCFFGHLPFLRLLSEERPGCLEDSNNLLHIAAWWGRVDVVRFLLDTCSSGGIDDRMVDPALDCSPGHDRLRNTVRITSSFYLSFERREECLRELIRRGADTTAPMDHGGDESAADFLAGTIADLWSGEDSLEVPDGMLERVLESLLLRAPADLAWERQKLLVLLAALQAEAAGGGEGPGGGRGVKVAEAGQDGAGFDLVRATIRLVDKGDAFHRVVTETTK